MEFYDLKLRQKVDVDGSAVVPTVYENAKGTRYALRTQTEDGRWLTKFCNKATYDTYNGSTDAESASPEDGAVPTGE